MPLNPLSDAAVELVKSTVGKVVTQLADHYLPPSMSDKEKEEFRLKAQELALDEFKATLAAQADINATMREEAKSEHWAQWLWRPFCGFTLAGVVINNYILMPYMGAWIRPITIPSEVWNTLLVVVGVGALTRGLKQVQQEKNN